MSIRRIIGGLILASPFALLFVAASVTAGIGVAVEIFGLIVFFAVAIFVGAWLTLQ